MISEKIETKTKTKETANAGIAGDYDSFLRENRYKVNHSLNRILWFCILAGPAIAVGILGGVFKSTTYLACLVISLGMAAVAGSNSLILKKFPYSYAPGVFALVAVDILLCYMNASHVSIRLTWVLVPLLSLLFCDRRVYVGTSILNYLVMALGTWLYTGRYAEISSEYSSPLGAFINIFAGCTIEAAVIFAAGFSLGKTTSNYYRRMTGQYAEVQSQKQAMQDQLNILDSMAEIYDYVNLIDFKESTETSLRDKKLHKIIVAPSQNHTQMTETLKNQIVADMAEEFWRFTDISTVRARLINRHSVSDEFISNLTGWFRAQYIRVQGEIDREPDVVIFTMQNIDADKRREEQLIRISRTDELTRMFNRHCYEEDIASIRSKAADPDLALISADVNGLKAVNDKMGHAAGDELIRGAAFCLFSSLGSCGKVYRTGGDEFLAVIHSSNPQERVDEIRNLASAWRGTIVSSLSISVGCASRIDHPGASVEDLEKIADKKMYEDKENFYRQAGNDRRER